MNGRMRGSGLDSKPILNTFKFQCMHFDIPSTHLTSVIRAVGFFPRDFNRCNWTSPKGIDSGAVSFTMNSQSIASCDCFTWVSSHLFWCSVDGTHQILKETRARNQKMPKTVCIANVLQISFFSSLRPPVQYSIMIIMLIHVHPPPKKKQNAKTRHHLLQDYSQLVSRYFTGAPFNKISRPLVATVRSPKRTSLPEQQLCLGYMAGDSR